MSSYSPDMPYGGTLGLDFHCNTHFICEKLFLRPWSNIQHGMNHNEKKQLGIASKKYAMDYFMNASFKLYDSMMRFLLYFKSTVFRRNSFLGSCMHIFLRLYAV